MSKKQLILFITACLAFLLVLGVYVLNKRNIPEQQPIIDEPEIVEEIPEAEQKTPIFDTFNRLTPQDASFILFKDEPSFIILDYFHGEDGGYSAGSTYEELNEKYGFKNLAYVIELDNMEFPVDEDGDIEFGDIYLPNKPAIVLIWEGKAAASLETSGKTIDEIDEFIGQFYDLSE